MEIKWTSKPFTGETLMNHFLSALKSAFVTRYASFRGRSGRGELLLCLFVEFLLFAVWIALCGTLLAQALYNWDKIWFTAALILVLTPPLISVHVRRLHDINWNGFWLWLWPVPVAQIFLWVVLFLRKGTAGPNRYDDARPPRPLRRNPVCWGVAVLLCWMCVPLLLEKLPARITPETHFITEPRTPDGHVDYYTPLIAQYAEMFKDPEQNGVRDLLQMFGPQILMDFTVRDPKAPEYQFVPLTYEKLDLPLDTKPEFPDYKSLNWEWLRDHLPVVEENPRTNMKYVDVSSLKISPEDYARVEIKEPETLSDPAQSEDALRFYVSFHLSQPWKDEDHPLASEWLKENDPILDRVAAAIRKPYLMPFFSEYELGLHDGWSLWPFKFVAPFQIRAAHSLEIGEEEKALEDARTLILLGQHWQKGPTSSYVTYGIRIESYGFQTLQIALKSGKLSPQGLEKLAAMLDEIMKMHTQQPSLRKAFERSNYEAFAYLQSGIFTEDQIYSELDLQFINEKTFRKTFHKVRMELREKMFPDESFTSFEEYQRILSQLGNKYFSPWSEPWRLLTGTYYRNLYSRYWAFVTASLFEDASPYILLDFFNNRTYAKVLRVAAELERYKLKNGAYPETLAELGLPQDVLTDPFSPTKEPLKYRLNPETEEAFWKRYETWKKELPDYIVKRIGYKDDEEFAEPIRLQWRPYLLYSVGPDQKNEGGQKTWSISNHEGWVF